MDLCTIREDLTLAEVDEVVAGGSRREGIRLGRVLQAITLGSCINQLRVQTLKKGELILQDAAKTLTEGRRIVVAVGVGGVAVGGVVVVIVVGVVVDFGLGAMNTIE